MSIRTFLLVSPLFGVLSLMALQPAVAQTDPQRVYRCPDNSYTNDLSEVKSKNCTLVDNANVSIMSAPGTPAPAPAAKASGQGGQRSAQVPPDAQRQRDIEARAILEQELAQQKAKLVQQLKDYNNGQPERLGNEKNYQKYLDRVAAMKDGIAATQANISALERELQKYPQ